MKKFVLIFCMVSLVAACTSSEVETVRSRKVFRASIEEGTRTFNYGGYVLWVEGDAISVFDHDTDNKSYVFQGETGDLSGEFVEQETEDAGQSASVPLPYTYAIYPYATYNEVSEDGTILGYVTPEQYYLTNSFYTGINPMAAVTTDDVLSFRNLAGYLNVRLWGDPTIPIESVTLSSNNDEIIAGDILATLPLEGGAVVVPCEGSDYLDKLVVLYLSNGNEGTCLGASADEPLDLWFVLTPGQIASGITLTVTTMDGREFTKVNENPLTIKRSVCTETAPLEVTFPDLPEEVEVPVLFSDDFEDASRASEWTLVDADKDGCNWTYHINAETSLMTTHSGDGLLISESYRNGKGALTPNNWAFTPAIQLTTDNYLSFWVAAQDLNWCNETYGIYITKSKPTVLKVPQDCEFLFGSTYPGGDFAQKDGTYQRFLIPIPEEYANSKAYIAFRHFDCTDMFILNIDDVSVTEGCPLVQQAEVAGAPVREAPRMLVRPRSARLRSSDARAARKR